jgi:hypothetical protein
VTFVFKFTKRKYVDDALHHGRFRFAHVSAFRVGDGVEDGRSDAGEMVARANVCGGEETVLSTDPRLEGRFTFRRAGDEVPVEIIMSGAVVEFFDSGMLFCALLDNSDELFQTMTSKFGADAAYEIIDVEEFARRIESHILDTGDHLDDVLSRHRHPNSSLGADFNEAMRRFQQHELDQQRDAFEVKCRPVTYVDRVDAPSIAEMVDDPFQKPASYGWQREYRILLAALEGRDHYDIKMPSLRELIRVVR